MLLIWFIIFVVASIFLFTIPGFYLIGKTKIKITYWEQIFIGTVIGYIFYTLLSYTLLYLNIHHMIIPFMVLGNIYIISTKQIKISIPTIPINKSLILLIAIFTIGIIGQLAVISPSGSYSRGNLLFWSSHGHDGAWHIALMNEIQNGYPLQNPTLSGEKLVNYHFFSDIAPSDFNYYFKIPAIELYFRFFPLLFSLLLATSAYYLGKRIGKNHLSGIGVLFFTCFAGSFGYIVTWIKSKQIAGESIFYGTQVQSSSGNPPQIVSNFMIITFIFLFSYQVSQLLTYKYLDR